MGRCWRDTLADHTRVVEALRDAGPTLEAIGASLVECIRAGHCVYIFGNGGSAADAQHIAAELLGRFRLDRRALPALALTTDSSTLTAIANDLGYDHVFARQLQGLVRPGDIAWGLSTSGGSANVLAGLRTARERGAKTVGFTGARGERMAELCSHLFRVPHDRAERIQEAHLIAYHYVCELVEAELAG